MSEFKFPIDFCQLAQLNEKVNGGSASKLIDLSQDMAGDYIHQRTIDEMGAAIYLAIPTIHKNLEELGIEVTVEIATQMSARLWYIIDKNRLAAAMMFGVWI